MGVLAAVLCGCTGRCRQPEGTPSAVVLQERADRQDTPQTVVLQMPHRGEAVSACRTQPYTFDIPVRARRLSPLRRAVNFFPQTFHHPAVWHRLSTGGVHILNVRIAHSRALPLSLPPERVSFPFHDFW